MEKNPPRFRLLAFAALLAAALLSSACRSEVFQLNEMDNGRILVCAPGDVIEVRLPGNPTTGYMWMQARQFDNRILVKTGDEFLIDQTKQNLVGAPGIFFFSYQVMEKGKAGLRLEYRRPWEENQPPASRFEVLVDAQ